MQRKKQIHHRHKIHDMQDNKKFELKSRHKTLVQQHSIHNFVKDQDREIKQKEEMFRVRKMSQKRKEEYYSKKMLGRLSKEGKNKQMSQEKLWEQQKNKNRYETINGQFKRRANRSQYRIGFEYSTQLKALPESIKKSNFHRNLRQNRTKSVDQLHFHSLRPQKSSSSKNKLAFQNILHKVRKQSLVSSQQQTGQHTQTQQKLNYQQLKNDNNRFPDGFIKSKLLGRGGFSIVWSGVHMKTKANYAVKQILTQNKYQTHLKQIWFGTYFFKNGKPKKQFQKHPGSNNLLVMYDYDIGEIDSWIVYEMCDGSLGSMLYSMVKYNNIHTIKYKSLYLKMRKSTTFLRSLIIQISKALDLLSMNQIVHSDLKTQNILVKQIDEQNWQFKLIDYGSSFSFNNMKQYSLATPEYMCPQLLNYVLYQNKQNYNKQLLQNLRNYDNSSAIDIWGLGCVVLELIHGLPLWVKPLTKLQYKQQQITLSGLFSYPKSSSQSFKIIMSKQFQYLKDIDHFIKHKNYSNILLDNQLIQVIKGMLEIDSSKRMRPRQILKILGHEITCTKFSLLDH